MLDKTLTHRLIGAGIMIVAAAIILPQVLNGKRPPELGVQVEVSKAPVFPEAKIAATQPVDNLPDTSSTNDVTHVSVTNKHSTTAIPIKQPQDITLVPADKASVKKDTSVSNQSAQTGSSSSSAAKASTDKQTSVASKSQPKPQMAVRWTVQIATFANEANAKRLVDKLKKANYSAYSITSSSLNKVYVGPEFERSASEKTMSDIKKKFGLKGFVTKFSEN
ncbi:SPOR domain-containing protein [Marinomonas spartinae]|uniref:SPOR domain-containing protein n=1 Tax=Marinomonas spartinae TaxID=1792290 RepID=UPI0018F2633E|nr:SPOR domain-containing protein [Marinomonas spartinae]MBJ7553392.1 SPOR domain-containing protein [Marinomonas spartinae]